MFSGFYLALLLVLVFLMVRVVSFEWRGKGDQARWRRTWTAANVTGSVGAPFLWGVALANLLNGVPLDSKGDFAGSFWDLFSPYTVAAGAVVVLVCAFHGATFLTLRMAGDLRRRAAETARLLSVPAVLAGGAFLIWTVVVAVDNNDRATLPPAIPAALAILALFAALALVRLGREGWAFAATAASMVGLVATIFTGLYPRVLVSSPDFANSLTISNAASAHYTLAVITVVALVVTPVVLLYQGWTYYVFRARLTGPGARRTRTRCGSWTRGSCTGPGRRARCLASTSPSGWAWRPSFFCRPPSSPTWWRGPSPARRRPARRRRSRSWSPCSPRAEP